MGRRPGAADPPVAARYVPRIAGRHVDGAAEPPPLPFQEQLTAGALGGGQPVGGHPLDGPGRQEPAPVAVEGAAGEEHPGEGVVVVDRRHQSAGAGREGGGAAPLAVRPVDQFQTADVARATAADGPVVGGEPAQIPGRHLETRVRHAERLEDPLLQEHGQGAPGGPGDQHALDVGAGVVQPGLARLVQQRNPRQRLHPGIRRRNLVRQHRPLLQLAEQRGHRGQREVGGEPDAGPGGEQVGDGDRAGGGHHVVDPARGRTHHDRRLQFRQPRPDRIVQREPAVLDQHHHGRGRDRLGQRGDPEDRIPDHRRGPLRIGRPGGLDLHPAAAGHQPHRTGHRAAVHVRLQDVAQTGHHSTSPAVQPSDVGHANPVRP